MKDINLLQSFQSERRQFDLARYRRRAMGGVLALAVLLGGCYGALRYGTARFDRETEALSAEALSYTEVSDVKGSITEMEARLESLRALLSEAAESSSVSSALLDTLASALGGEIYLTSLTVEEKGLVSLSGTAAARDGVTDLLYNLKKTGVFSDVSIGLVNAAKPESGGAETYDFTINGSLKGGEAGE